MDELSLRHSVELEGRDIFGRKALMVVEPNSDRNGWVWNVGSERVPITADLFTHKPRRVALECNGHTLNEFEHIGILRAAGLQHVKIWLPGKNCWPPYDGGSLALWQAVMPHTYKSGTLKPYCAYKNWHYHMPRSRDRYVTYLADTNDHKLLQLTGVIDFPKYQSRAYRFTFEYPKDNLFSLVSARTLGWPPSVRYVALAASGVNKVLNVMGREWWPHYNRMLWPGQAPWEQVLGELGRHRFLDALGVINFAAPDGYYLAGGFHSVKGGHATDVALLKQLAQPKVVAFRRSVA